MLETLLQLTTLIFIFNLIPVFMPPTSLVMSFFYIQSGIDIYLLSIITALSAISGRLILAILARRMGEKFLANKVNNGYVLLSKIVHKNNLLTILFMALYCILPLTTAEIFIVAGVAKFKLWPIIIGFIIGRFLNYVITAATISTFYSSFSDVLAGGIFNPLSIFFQILAMALTIAFLFLDWEKLITQKKIGFHRSILKKN